MFRWVKPKVGSGGLGLSGEEGVFARSGDLDISSVNPLGEVGELLTTDTGELPVTGVSFLWGGDESLLSGGEEESPFSGVEVTFISSREILRETGELPESREVSTFCSSGDAGALLESSAGAVLLSGGGTGMFSSSRSE